MKHDHEPLGLPSRPARSRASRAVAAAAFALTTAAATLAPAPAAAAPELQDYRYFRALSIDLQGRIPSRDELAAFEKDGFDLDTWIDERLSGPLYAERVRRVYMDLLRLEIGNTFNFRPKPIVLRRATIIAPNGQKQYVYYRQGQRRARVETDGVFCMTFAESGLKTNTNGTITGTPKQVTQAVLDANTTTVKPWWLYRDYTAASPSEKFDEATWADMHPGYRPVDGLLEDAEGGAAGTIRVCKEEAKKPAKGTVFATGLVDPPAQGEDPPYERLVQLPRDTKFAQDHAGEDINCGSMTAHANSADCGCGVGLERCVPGAGNNLDPQAFVLPTDAPLGRELPFESSNSNGSEWSRQAWAAEAAAFIDDIVGKDRDFREILTSKGTVVNGPAAQFHRFFAGSGCCTDTASTFNYPEATPLTDPSKMPDLLPHDVNSVARIEDRGPLASGLLTMPIFLTKYGTRRARAHVLYNAFLCKEFTSSNSELIPSEEPDLTKRSGCQDCHATLEPMAAYFSRIKENDWVYLPPDKFPLANPYCKLDGNGNVKTSCKGYYDPAFASTDAGELRGAHASAANAEAGPGALAATITASEEFPRCVAQNVMASFLGRPLHADDDALHEEMTSAFIDGEMHMRALVRALVKSEAYRLANDRLSLEGQ